MIMLIMAPIMIMINNNYKDDYGDDDHHHGHHHYDYDHDHVVLLNVCRDTMPESSAECSLQMVMELYAQSIKSSVKGLRFTFDLKIETDGSSVTLGVGGARRLWLIWRKLFPQPPNRYIKEILILLVGLAGTHLIMLIIFEILRGLTTQFLVGKEQHFITHMLHGKLVLWFQRLVYMVKLALFFNNPGSIV